MKKILAGLALALLTSGVLAQAVIRGEESAGSYSNLKSTSGVLQVLDNNTPANLAAASVATLTAQGGGTVTSSDQANNYYRCAHVIVDITVITGTSPTLTVTIQGKDAVSGKYYTILASAALSTVSTTILKVCPGITAAANVAVSDLLPRDWRVSYTVAGTTPAVTATTAVSYVR